MLHMAKHRRGLAYVLIMQGRLDDAAPFEKMCRDGAAGKDIRGPYIEYLDLAHATRPRSP